LNTSSQTRVVKGKCPKIHKNFILLFAVYHTKFREADLFMFKYERYCGQRWDEFNDVYKKTHPNLEINETVMRFFQLRRRLNDVDEFVSNIVLDVGAGSGRLTFAAAVQAKEVYASEPVGTLREFIRVKAIKENIANVRVVEALITSIPYPDNSFDIVMSGHVVGDFWDEETAELIRVCKSGGWLLDCPGYDEDCEDQSGDDGNDEENELVKRGWESMGYDRYRKQVFK